MGDALFDQRSIGSDQPDQQIGIRLPTEVEESESFGYPSWVPQAAALVQVTGYHSWT